MKLNREKVAIIFSLNGISKWRSSNLKFLENFYSRQDVYVHTSTGNDDIYSKEKNWNEIIKRLPESIEYVFLSDADVLETPKFNILQKSLDALIDNDWDGMQCFTHIRYLSPIGTANITGKDEDWTGFNRFSFLKKIEKSGVNGGKACGGLLLFKKEYLQKVPLIDYCIMGSGDTINMSVWMPHEQKLPHEKVYNDDLWNDIIERRARREIRFGALPATLLHLYHRSTNNDNYLLRNAFIFQIYKQNIMENLEELLPYPQVKNIEEYGIIKKRCCGLKTIKDLVLYFNNLREKESDDLYRFLYLHENKSAYTVTDNSSPHYYGK